jgi:abequosyltransferase
MQPIRDRFWLTRTAIEKMFNLHDPKEMIDYCNKANSIGALFSYWSSIVLRREDWAREGYKYDFDGSAYAMAASLLSFLKKRCRLKYIRDSLVLWRTGNESFQDQKGLVERFLLDFNGYLRLADTFLADDKAVKDAFLKVMTREHPWYTIINVTSFINDRETWLQFKAKMLKFGYDPKMLDICFTLGRFKKLVSLGVQCKRKAVKNRTISKFMKLFHRE